MEEQVNFSNTSSFFFCCCCCWLVCWLVGRLVGCLESCYYCFLQPPMDSQMAVIGPFVACLLTNSGDGSAKQQNVASNCTLPTVRVKTFCIRHLNATFVASLVPREPAGRPPAGAISSLRAMFGPHDSLESLPRCQGGEKN